VTSLIVKTLVIDCTKAELENNMKGELAEKLQFAKNK
jgi:hypothetical protein